MTWTLLGCPGLLWPVGRLRGVASWADTGSRVDRLPQHLTLHRPIWGLRGC